MLSTVSRIHARYPTAPAFFQALALLLVFIMVSEQIQMNQRASNQHHIYNPNYSAGNRIGHSIVHAVSIDSGATIIYYYSYSIWINPHCKCSRSGKDEKFQGYFLGDFND